MSSNLKLLVCGDVEGKFKQIFKRVSLINQKSGPFDMLLCVGEFFGDDMTEWEEYKSGQAKVPLPVYVLGPTRPGNVSEFDEADGGELCSNVTFLGKKGVFTGTSGLQIAYLSGLEDAVISDKTTFSAIDMETLRQSLLSDRKYQGVDILLTSQWPRGVDKYATTVTEFDASQTGSPLIAQLSRSIRPRYHFCGQQGAFYERQPYRNHKVLQEKERHVTRFIGMAKVGNPDKKKFIYAFNITPLSQMAPAELTKQPTDVTECPFKADGAATSQPEDKEKGAQFFYDIEAAEKEAQKGKKRGPGDQGGPDRKKPPKPTGPCWFCLGSPEVEKHLVVSVATQTYLALAKGGLTEDHILITPIGHYQSTVTAPPEVIKEIEQYKDSLRKCFKSHGKAVVFFERNYKTQHLQIQVVPVPADLVSEVKETFIGCGLSQDINLQEIPVHSDIKQIVPVGAPYFYTELPSGEKLLHRISKSFPLQFGREALAHDSLLNMEDRIDWRNCKMSKEEETSIAKDFKQMFKAFDFSLD